MKKIHSCQHQDDMDENIISGQGQWVTSTPTLHSAVSSASPLWGASDLRPRPLPWGWAPRGGRSVGGRRSQPMLGRRSTYVEHRRSFDCQVCWEVYYELEYKNLGVCVCVCVVRFYSLCLLRCLLCKKQPHLLDWIIEIYISTHVVLRTRPGMKGLMPTT